MQTIYRNIDANNLYWVCSNTKFCINNNNGTHRCLEPDQVKQAMNSSVIGRETWMGVAWRKMEFDSQKRIFIAVPLFQIAYFQCKTIEYTLYNVCVHKVDCTRFDEMFTSSQKSLLFSQQNILPKQNIWRCIIMYIYMLSPVNSIHLQIHTDTPKYNSIAYITMLLH